MQERQMEAHRAASGRQAELLRIVSKYKFIMKSNVKKE